MTGRKKLTTEVRIQDISVIDLILIDHRFIKECIEVLTDDDADKRKKWLLARSFLDAVHAHAQAEKKAIYAPLESNEELHFNILEAGIEHGIVEQKVKSLKTKISKARSLKDDIEAELKVLSELVKHHIMEEESEMLPKILKEVDAETLSTMGKNFMKLRKFTAKDIQNYPELHDELIQWKDSIQKVSSEFLTKMDKFVENMQH
ncbi:MAG TPA: hemerythrin domain-containing protein [Bacteriovoracaceae bacterium]|nr:hemerythrin domain-containing protein [Bacteriovoracaceae bacterium]